jgi:prevent-host-death family protein
MVKVGVSEARAKLPELLEAAANEPVMLERRGEPAGVLVSPEQYERFVDALEEHDDVAAFDEALREGGPNVPWSEVKAELGW